MGVRVALAAFVVLALSASCDGGDPSPTTLPTSPPTSAATTAPTSTPPPSPTPTAPTLPAAAREDSPAGAEAFARFWLTALDYAYKTGDTKPFRALGTCQSCKSLADGIDRHYAAGGRFEGGSFSAKSSRTAEYVKSSAALVDLIYSRETGQAVPGSGTPTPVPPEADVEFAVTLKRQPEAQQWQVTGVKAVKR